MFIIYIFILFSKAKAITISSTNHWCYTLTARSTEPNPETETVCLRPSGIRESSTLPEEMGVVTIPQKYPEGKHLKIKADKLQDLKYLKNYLTDSGQRWVDEVIKGQETAGMIDILNIIWFVYVVFILTVNNIISLWIY